jgi:hypothetical protein
MIEIQAIWLYLLAASPFVAGGVMLIVHLRTAKKLHLEINALERARDKEESRIARPTLEQVRQFTKDDNRVLFSRAAVREPGPDELFPTAIDKRIPQLYHWQRFNADRLAQQLAGNYVYCSEHRSFNDPWDCKPFFNTDILNDPVELQKHIDWSVEICQKHTRMSVKDIEQMKRALKDRGTLASYVTKMSNELSEGGLDHYRVYCLGPNVSNLLMWAHYADRHRGICLEFNVRNDTICGAMQVQYYKQFPMMRAYDKGLRANLLPLFAKDEHWLYEQEYRIIAQENAHVVGGGTLICENGILKLADGALVSVIVGHEGSYEEVCDLAAKHAPHIRVRRARLVPNQYRLDIEP